MGVLAGLVVVDRAEVVALEVGKLTNKIFVVLFFLVIFFSLFYNLGNDNVTTDDTHFKNWSYVFMKEFEAGNYEKLYVTVQPGVLTIYSNIVGFKAFHFFKDKLGYFQNLSLRETDLFIHIFSKIPKVMLVLICIVVCYYLVNKIFGNRKSLVFLTLLGLEPFLLGHSRVIQTDILPAYLVFISALLLYQDKKKHSLLIGLLLGLACIEKASSLIVLPVFLFFIFGQWKIIAKFLGSFIITVLALFPAFWGDFGFTLWRFTIGSFIQGIKGLDAETFTYAPSPHVYKWYFYIKTLFVRLSEISLIGLVMFIVTKARNTKLKDIVNPLVLTPFVLFLVLQLATKKGERFMLFLFPFIILAASIGVTHFLKSKIHLYGFLIAIVLLRLFQILPIFPDYLLYTNPITARGTYDLNKGFGWGFGGNKLSKFITEKYGRGRKVHMGNYESLRLFYDGKVRNFDDKTCNDTFDIVIQTSKLPEDSCYLDKLVLDSVFKVYRGPTFFIYTN